jgi:hypothetical protein
MEKKETVADILDLETKSTIAEWLRRVDSEADIIAIPMTTTERSGHLPEMFRDVIIRLRSTAPLGTRALISDAAHDHGLSRRDQGYTLQ